MASVRQSTRGFVAIAGLVVAVAAAWWMSRKTEARVNASTSAQQRRRPEPPAATRVRRPDAGSWVHRARRDPGLVACGDAPCRVPQQRCCMSAQSESKTCVAATSACPEPGYDITCDEPGDCQTGEVCCLVPGGSACMAASACTQARGWRLCVERSDCELDEYCHNGRCAKEPRSPPQSTGRLVLPKR